MITFNCPTCGKSFSLRDEHAGRKGRCSCGAAITIPGGGWGGQTVPQGGSGSDCESSGSLEARIQEPEQRIKILKERIADKEAAIHRMKLAEGQRRMDEAGRRLEAKFARRQEKSGAPAWHTRLWRKVDELAFRLAKPTPLGFASFKGLADVVKVLLDANADVDGADREGSTPLRNAAYNGHAAVVRLLLDANANVNARMAGGGTPLYYATVFDHPEVVKLLLDAGADISIANSEGETPAYVAAKFDRREISRLLETPQTIRTRKATAMTKSVPVGDKHLPCGEMLKAAQSKRTSLNITKTDCAWLMAVTVVLGVIGIVLGVVFGGMEGAITGMILGGTSGAAIGILGLCVKAVMVWCETVRARKWTAVERWAWAESLAREWTAEDEAAWASAVAPTDEDKAAMGH